MSRDNYNPLDTHRQKTQNRLLDNRLFPQTHAALGHQFALLFQANTHTGGKDDGRSNCITMGFNRVSINIEIRIVGHSLICSVSLLTPL